MSKVVVLGHGGYGSGVKRNMNMLVGEAIGFSFIDFNEQDDLSILQNKINAVLDQNKGEDILFACDLTGGSPFREAATICVDHPNFAVVAGLNTSAYTEMTFNLEMPPRELAELAVEVAKESIMIFPPKE